LTDASAVCATSFEAVTPVAALLPEFAVVTPPATAPPLVGVGASATLTPERAVAALVSITVLECWLSTVSTPGPLPTTPALSCVLLVFVSARPASASVLPLAAFVAASGVVAL
jgi:hypothetical protein